jgi:uncharacterized coiled-coil protein SlyX
MLSSNTRALELGPLPSSNMPLPDPIVLLDEIQILREQVAEQGCIINELRKHKTDLEDSVTEQIARTGQQNDEINNHRKESLQDKARIAVLEARVNYRDDTVGTLNGTIDRQEEVITKLAKRVEELSWSAKVRENCICPAKTVQMRGGGKGKEPGGATKSTDAVG